MPLSKQAVIFKTEDISVHLSCSLKQSFTGDYTFHCLFVKAQTTDTSQLLVYDKAVNKDFTIVEELLKECKLSAVVTDGSTVMVGTSSDFIGLFQQNQLNMLTLHCIIHQEAGCAKLVTLIELCVL